MSVSSLTLSCVCMFVCVCVQKQLLMDEGQNVMKKVLDTYLLFFQINQSTTTLRHVFAALRLFVQKVGWTDRLQTPDTQTHYTHHEMWVNCPPQALWY